MRSLIETPATVAAFREPGARDLVAVAVRERDDAGHHVVDAADLDVDGADPRGHPDDRAVSMPRVGEVLGVHEQVVARPARG